MLLTETSNLGNILANICKLISDENKIPDVTPVKPNDKEEVSEDETKQKKKKRSIKHRITWLGTSLSKALDKNKFEKDLNVNLVVKNAYCIKEEGRYKKSNFAAIVPEIVEKGDFDTLVLQTGSIEITNLEVNKAMMDVKKSLNEYKKEWFAKVENDSENLFVVAEEAIARDSHLNVVIVKRFSRFDRTLSEMLGIKTQLSKFTNHVMINCG